MVDHLDSLVGLPDKRDRLFLIHTPDFTGVCRVGYDQNTKHFDVRFELETKDASAA